MPPAIAANQAVLVLAAYSPFRLVWGTPSARPRYAGKLDPRLTFAQIAFAAQN